MIDLRVGDCREILPTLADESVHCCVTSPPYWGLRDYGHGAQIGLEPRLDEFIDALVEVFREVRRVLRDDGTLWLNLGDSYAGAAGGWQGKNGERASRTFTARIKHRKGRGSGRPKLNGRGERVREGTKQASNAAADFDGPHRCVDQELKPKDLVGVPWRVALALQADGWWLRSDIIWSKPNPMPESIKDRPTKAHEYLFLLAKSERYYYDAAAIAEPATWAGPNAPALSPHGQGFAKRSSEQEKERQRSKQDGHGRRHEGFNGRYFAQPAPLERNKRTVWTVATTPTPEAHFATFPRKLVEPCVLAGCPAGGVVLDPFAGTGTVGRVAEDLGRNSLLIELNPDYAAMAERKTAQLGLVP